MSTTPLFVDFTAMLVAALGDRVAPSGPGFLGLMAEDATMEFPYAPPGRPSRVTGHADLDRYLRPLDGAFTIESFTGPEVHATTNPSVVILEYALEARIHATGGKYEQRYISVITLRDRKIVHFRDYWNPLATSGLVRSST